ncbi:MAG: hypothetical protein L6R38_004685 [Xanthoria sp. 2 TBL-2021]|nr:MAG: hypothetical protein L6R38_004685 [Xanthoria sp. 2 TBL-2021]
MEAEGGLESLRALHQDLIALEDGQLRNIDKLCNELKAHVEAFKNLLDRPTKSDTSRKKLESGTIQIEESDYAVNKEFQESSIQLADALNLDELRAAELLLDAQGDAELLGRSTIVSAVINYHEKRQFLLESLRMLFRNAEIPDREEVLRHKQLEIVGDILEVKDGPARNGSLFTRKCFKAMADIERWIQDLAERYQGTLALGQSMTIEYDEIMAFQQSSLAQQHESLGAIVTYLVKGSYTNIEDFFQLLQHLSTIERWNHIPVHYVPAIAAFTSQYGSPDNGGSLREARMLHKRIMDGRDSSPWALRNLQAAMVSWWLAEYSGWYLEQRLGSPVQGADLEAEARARSDAFLQALKDGAFHCTLSICSQVYPDDIYDPARNGLTDYLLRDTPPLPTEAMGTNALFRDLLLEQIESFINSFISNMPDTLRQFQISEDDQRKKILGGIPSQARSSLYDQDLDLERFLVIIAYTFDQRTEAAEAFWEDPDSNLYGFLQWASKRQSTPRVGAFCELLRSISRGEECATAAHKFLLDQGSTKTARIRRSSSLNWSQIFSELNLYAAKIRETPGSSRPPIRYGGKANAGDIDEPESALMLECYLRLMAHICKESSEARSWLWTHETFRSLEVLFTLADVSVPPRLQACAIATVAAMLTNKTLETSLVVWGAMDQWASSPTASMQAISRPGKPMTPMICMEEVTLEALSKTFDQANEFINLLQTLVSPGADEIGLHDALPFPEQLGGSYRMPGIEPYIDFAIGKIFAAKPPVVDDPVQSRLLTNNVLNLAATCLSVFNENLVILANRSTIAVDTAIEASSLDAYARLHPFSRVMEWMFNDGVLAVLFAASNQDLNVVAAASPNSPIVLTVLRSIEVMNRILDLQSTYFEILRPLVKLQTTGHRHPVLNPTLASFEDSVATNLDLVVNLGLYSGLGNQELAINSLKLLERLSSSRRLNASLTPVSRQRPSGNRLVGVLEQHGDLERVRTSFILGLQYDDRELDLGPGAPGWTIKSVMLDFLSHCLAALPDRPNLAHAILGFACTGATLSIEPDGAFTRGASLFHSIVRMVAEYPDGLDNAIQLWSSSIRQKAMRVLSILRASPLSSVLAMAELRAADFLFAMFLRQAVITPDTNLDGLSIRDENFVQTDSALVLELYLDQRCTLLEYASSELRLVAAEGAPTQKARILSTLFGSTTMYDGTQLPNVPVFELLDFLGADFSAPVLSPVSNLFTELDFTVALGPQDGTAGEAAQLHLVEQLLALKLNEVRKSGYLENAQDQENALLDAEAFVAYFRTQKSLRSLEEVRLRTLKAWSNLLALAIGHCELDQGGRASLVLQALQTVMPKLERYAVESSPEALVLAKLVQTLFFQVDLKSSALDQTKVADLADDRFFNIFRTSLRAINVPEGDVNLREALYNICFRYLTSIADPSGSKSRQHNISQMVKTSGKKTIDIICDDAYGGSGTCRASAVLFLDALTATALIEKSSYMIDSLARTNFIVVLVEAIRDIPNELRDAEPQDIPLLLSYYNSKLSLLLTLSQTRPGATQVINAGLFQTIRDSGLFSVDPDLGISTADPTSAAVSKYYALLLAVIRVIAAVLVSRGPQNQQTIEQTKQFLAENRTLVVSVFKRQAGIGIGGASVSALGEDDSTMGRVVDELVELFVLLMTRTEFIDVSKLTYFPFELFSLASIS